MDRSFKVLFIWPTGLRSQLSLEQTDALMFKLNEIAETAYTEAERILDQIHKVVGES